jgi:hypothetical protein
MSQQNLISVSVAEEDLAEVRSAITVLRDKLAPYLQSLSPQDRQELPKMGDKSVAFVQKALEYCRLNSELVPPYLDVDEFEQDFQAVLSLRELYQPLAQLVQSLEDSQLLSGSDAYQAALMFYTSIKSAKKSNIAGAQTIYEDLSNRFPANYHKKEES